jgi:hypothetical protein
MSDTDVVTTPLKQNPLHSPHVTQLGTSTPRSRRGSDACNRIKHQLDDISKSILENLRPKLEQLKEDPIPVQSQLTSDNKLLKECLGELEQGLYLVITNSHEKLVGDNT